jgi:EAL domain-containing protein (putative c-di-GMP-specific phosphodiesterase class I)
MYQAKDRGRNNFQLFSQSMDKRLKQRIAIESSLRTALQSNQLDVHYQPIVDIETHKVVALEALMRWKHPSHGYVRPERFVAVAEEAGLIVPIGDFVLQRAIEDMVRWRQMYGSLVPVAVNISAVQLQRSNLAENISRLTKQHGLDPKLLQIELTESAVFERREPRAREASQDAVAKLRELGVHIAIDDFGTGYSSLSYLKRWRVDTLKIDRSFVRDLVTDMRWLRKASRAGSSWRSCASSAAITRRGTCSPARHRRRTARGISRARRLISPSACPPWTGSKLPRTRTRSTWRCAREFPRRNPWRTIRPVSSRSPPEANSGHARMSHAARPITPRREQSAPAVCGRRAHGPSPRLRLQRGNRRFQHLPATSGSGRGRGQSA